MTENTENCVVNLKRLAYEGFHDRSHCCDYCEGIVSVDHLREGKNMSLAMFIYSLASDSLSNSGATMTNKMTLHSPRRINSIASHFLVAKVLLDPEPLEGVKFQTQMSAQSRLVHTGVFLRRGEKKLQLPI